MSTNPDRSADPDPSPEWWPYAQVYLAADDLHVERYEQGKRGEGYQRPKAERFIKRAVAEFEAALVNPPKVVRVAGGDWYAIIDGAHTVEILERVGMQPIPCLMHTQALGYEERARLYYEHNERRRELIAVEKFRGRFEASNDMALGLLGLLDEHGFYMQGYRPDDADDLKRLEKLPTLMAEYRNNAAALDVALGVLCAWRAHSMRSIERVALQALCRLARQDHFDADRMRSLLGRHGPEYMTNVALGLDSIARRSPTLTSMKRALAYEYNKRLSEARRLDA